MARDLFQAFGVITPTAPEVPKIKPPVPGGRDLFKDFNVDLTQPAMSAGQSPGSSQPLTAARVIEGIPETTVAMGSSIPAEAAAGLAGIAGTLLPGPQGQGADWVEKTREALTYKPRTEPAKQLLGTIGEALSPIAEMMETSEQALGDTTYKLTGSPAMAAAAATVPTALMEATGLASAKIASGAPKILNKIKKAKQAKQIDTAIAQAAPTVDQIFDSSRAIFKELDESGAIVTKEAYNALLTEMEAEMRKVGYSPNVTRRAKGALDEFLERKDGQVSLLVLDQKRTIANKLALANDAAEAGVARAMVNTVDSFLDRAGLQALMVPEGMDAAKIGTKYRAARALWKRARKSELIDDAFNKALEADNYEHALKMQFKKILRNKNTRKFFDEHEVNMMRHVSKNKGPKLTKAVSALKDWGIRPNVFTGGGIGVAVAGAPGAGIGLVTLPIIGAVSKKLANKMLVKNAKFADQVIRAGKDARKVVDAYFKNVPKSQRSAMELSELLASPKYDLNFQMGSPLVKEAVGIAKSRLSGLGTATAMTGILPNQQEF